MNNYIYTAILKAKDGEFEAFGNLKCSSEKRFLPLFDVPTPRNKEAAKILEQGEDINSFFLKKISGKIKKFYKTGNCPIMFDMFYWDSAATIAQTGESVYEYFYNELKNDLLFPLPIIPVVNMDKWEKIEYQNSMINISANLENGYCIRANISRSDDYIDETELESILSSLPIDTKDIRLLLDLGYINEDEIDDIIFRVSEACDSVSLFNFGDIILSGSSVPKSITEVVQEQHSNNKTLRKEVKIWKALTNQGYNLTFADYGTRNPLPESEKDSIESPDQGFYLNKNKQIRYTINNNHYFVRGCPAKDGGTHRELTQKLIQSEHFSGPDYSWADQRILQNSIGQFKGNDSNWIAIDTNRHIEAVLDEVMEHLRTPALITQNSTLEPSE